MHAVAPHATQLAAFDPIAFFVLLVIVVNVISAFLKAGRRQAAQTRTATPPPPTLPRPLPSPLNGAAQAAERAAQLAAQRQRLQEAIQNARQQAARTAAQPAASIPAPKITVVTADAGERAAAARGTLATAARAAEPAGTAAKSMADAAQPLIQAELPAFEYSADLGSSGLMTTAQFAAVSSTAGGATPGEPASAAALSILGGRLTLADLVVASAILGPPASVRAPGHTPAGW
jgi:hypothetical protein